VSRPLPANALFVAAVCDKSWNQFCEASGWQVVALKLLIRIRSRVFSLRPGFGSIPSLQNHRGKTKDRRVQTSFEIHQKDLPPNPNTFDHVPIASDHRPQLNLPRSALCSSLQLPFNNNVLGTIPEFVHFLAVWKTVRFQGRTNPMLTKMNDNTVTYIAFVPYLIPFHWLCSHYKRRRKRILQSC
jgi:hypothetical protein